MKKLFFFLTTGGLLFFASCNRQDVESDFQVESQLKNAAALASASGAQVSPSSINGQKVLNFRAHLTGDQEVPQRETIAVGQAVFQLSKDGQELNYKVLVANLADITMAHIHLAGPGVNGPVVVWLYPSGPPAMLIPGTTNGILYQGVITEANLTGILSGGQLSDLIDQMVAGNAYANIHTSLYPGGEIRGQIAVNVPGE